MTYEWQINSGDTVKVFMDSEGKYLFYGLVRSMPQATGDAWIIESTDGVVTYVQTYAKIVRTKKGAR